MAESLEEKVEWGFKARTEALDAWPAIRRSEPDFYRSISALGEHMAYWQRTQLDSQNPLW